MLPFSAPLAFWPFTSGWMLLWGLTAAIPIIIHLWNRRKYNEVTWAAMEYLLAALRKNARRIRIEQLLLLAIRVLILLLLALALADPIFSLFPALARTLAAGQTHWVLVIDGSYSMDYRQGDQTRFERARELARQLVAESEQGDGFTLLLMADPPQVVIAEPAFDGDDIRSELDNLRMRHSGASLPSTLSEIAAIIDKSQKKQPRLVQTRVCFFTDLGHSTWNEVQSDQCRRQVGALAERATLVLLELGQPDDQENVAVTNLTLKESLVTVGRNVTLEATVQNFGFADRTRLRIEWRVDDGLVDEETVDLAAHDSNVVSLLHRFDAPGEHVVEVRLTDEALRVDNRRWASIPVRPSIRVLCVQGRPGDAKEVAYALEPFKSQRPRVACDVVPESAILERDLNQYDCLFLCNVGRFGRDEASVLHDYLRNGGGLVVMLGDQVQAESYNLELGGELSGKRVLPARLGDTQSGNQYFFDPLGYEHPIAAPFRGHERTGLLTTPIWKYFQLTPYSQQSRVALAFEGGDPALVEEIIERGRVVLFASAGSRTSVDRTAGRAGPWTDWPSWPSFVPLIQEMLALAVRQRTQDRALQVGQPLQGSIHSTAGDLPLTVQDPLGNRERVRLRIDGEDSRWVYEGTHLSGIYTAAYGAPFDRQQLFAVNVNTVESQLDRISSQNLPSQFVTDVRDDRSQQPALPVSRRRPYFRYFLSAVLALLLSETLLAWYFGNAPR